jgi:magnesium transporter
MNPTKYLDYIFNPASFLSTKKVLKVNPTAEPSRTEPENSLFCVNEYSNESCITKHLSTVEETYPFLHSTSNTWINIDGLKKVDVEKICAHFEIHALIAEDILSLGQRSKMDEINNHIFCMLNMLSFNEKTGEVETEQISIILGKKYVISFQEEAHRDPFDTLREKLKISNSKLRQTGADFLLYSLIDYIVDYYFTIMEKIGDKIELLEEEIVKKAEHRSLVKINALRKEMILLKRSIGPVRELVGGILRSESELIEERTEKYFKDVYDHIIQAHDLSENYRDMITSLQDLYLNNVNLRMNEVMKVMAIVTCLLAPATVIGGIFGMNFENVKWLHTNSTFTIAAFSMVLIPLIMIRIFKKRGWF